MARQKPERKMRGPKPKRRGVTEESKSERKVEKPAGRVCRDCHWRGSEPGNRRNNHAWCPLKRRYVMRKLKACGRFNAKGGGR
jgi:hypothetical protein